MTIARQRLGKNIPEGMLSTIEGHVAGYRTNEHMAITICDKHERRFLCGPCRDALLGNCVVAHLYNNRGAVFSVLCGPCHDCIRETV
jgi:hypothetical protein